MFTKSLYNKHKRKNMTSVSVRSASEADSKDIFEWRNDELTRHMSHTSEFVDWDGHSKWFANSLASESRLLMVCEDVFGKKISVVRFDISNDNALVSISLNPNERGKGLAKLCLNNSIDCLYKKHSHLKYLIAEIKEANIASQKTFLGVGFKKCKLKDDVGYYEKTLD